MACETQDGVYCVEVCCDPVLSIFTIKATVLSAWLFVIRVAVTFVPAVSLLVDLFGHKVAKKKKFPSDVSVLCKKTKYIKYLEAAS